MPIVNPEHLDSMGDKPELIFGLVAAVGTPLEFVVNELRSLLTEKQYVPDTIRLSDYIPTMIPGVEVPSGENEYQRLNRLMDWGNEVREQLRGGEALALLAVAHINSKRPESAPPLLNGNAFLIQQLKHPDEVIWLRRIYGPLFHLLGIYCSESVRTQYLRSRGLSDEEILRIMERDAGEEEAHGQKLTETFYRSDYFVELVGLNDEAKEYLRDQLSRYLDLVLGERIITPTIDEYGMFMAYAASLRSADLSRQVGASLLTENGELVAVGTNEVPAPGGGQYWGGENDQRDFIRGFDANTEIRSEIVREIVSRLDSGWDEMTAQEQDDLLDEAMRSFKGSRLMNITEFGRAVHAEMEAILAAARQGKSVRNCVLYTTTFPCHNCAKHIVGAGISKTVYIEPYPKSLASRLHDDSVSLASESTMGNKVLFRPFIGVAPRIYSFLFSSLTPEGTRIKRKSNDGRVIYKSIGLRPKPMVLNHVDRERMAALAIQKAMPS